MNTIDRNSFSTVTKYIGATNYRGTRIKADAEFGDKKFSVTISYPNTSDSAKAHQEAAEACLAKVLKYANRDEVNSYATLSLPIFARSYQSTGYIFFSEYVNTAK